LSVVRNSTDWPLPFTDRILGTRSSPTCAYVNIKICMTRCCAYEPAARVCEYLLRVGVRYRDGGPLPPAHSIRIYEIVSSKGWMSPGHLLWLCGQHAEGELAQLGGRVIEE
jgi:hypothetical protein